MVIMDNIFNILQIILAIVLVTAILLQQKGSGLGSAFGGGGNVYNTRRGMDKTLFNITIVVAILFFLVAVANLIV